MGLHPERGDGVCHPPWPAVDLDMAIAAATVLSCKLAEPRNVAIRAHPVVEGLGARRSLGDPWQPWVIDNAAGGPGDDRAWYWGDDRPRGSVTGFVGDAAAGG